eukprot:785586_1
MSSGNNDTKRRDSQIVFTPSTLAANVEPQPQSLPLSKAQASIIGAEPQPLLPTFDYYTAFLKDVTEKIYEIKELADIVYSTIITSNYDIDDILDDISSKTDSWIVTKISTKIIENDNISYAWNDEDNNSLY